MGIKHKDAKDIHRFAYVSDIDPGAIGADKGWIDISLTTPLFKFRNKNNDGWVVIGGDVMQAISGLVEQIIALTSQLANLEPSDIGLGSVNNTSDEEKPVSTAQAMALATKQPRIGSDTFTDALTIENETSAVLEVPVGCEICCIESVAANKNCLMKIYRTNELLENDLILEREVTAGVEEIVASPVLAKTVGESLWMRITNNGISGAITISVKFTPIAL